MRKWLLLVGVFVLALAASAGTAWAQQGISKTDLHAQNGSGEEGTATLTSIDATHTQVEITLSNAAGLDQPAHIHEGSCANLNPVPKYPLNNVVNGSSVTVINVPLTDVLGGRYAINVHKSKTEAAVYVACGDLTALISGGGTNPGMPTSGQPSLWSLAALVLAGGSALALLGLALRRRLA